MKKVILLFVSCWLCILCASALAATKITLINHITGVTGKPLENIQKRLAGLQTDVKLDDDSIQNIFQQGPNNIKQALQPFGYFRAEIQSRLVHSDNAWNAYFTITLGPPLPVTMLNIKIIGPGQDDPALINFLKKFPLKISDPFSTPTYQSAKQALLSTADNNGFVNASFSKQAVAIDLLNYTAAITLHLNTGERYYFGDIHIAPNPFADYFLKRYAKFKPGEVYSAEKVLNFQQNLSNSGYFQQVLITPDMNHIKNKAIPLQVTVKPVKPFRYLTGVGYGTDTGARGLLGFQWRRITDNGQNFSSNLAVSQIGSNLTGSYFIPGHDPMREKYNITTSFSSYNTALGKSTTQNYGVGYTVKDGLWSRSVALTFSKELYNLIGQTGDRSQLVIPSVSLTRLNTDDPIKPTYGNSFTINMQGAIQPVFSDTSFYQPTVTGKLLVPLSHYNRVLLRSSIGATIAKDFNQLPLSIRFGAGGSQSVRGYSYLGLGPGQYLMTGSVEFQQQIYPNFYLGAFYDAGNAFSDFHQSALLKSGAGPALIWASPVGTMELSFANALSSPGHPWLLQFSLGSLL